MTEGKCDRTAHVGSDTHTIHVCEYTIQRYIQSFGK